MDVAVFRAEDALPRAKLGEAEHGIQGVVACGEGEGSGEGFYAVNAGFSLRLRVDHGDGLACQTGGIAYRQTGEAIGLHHAAFGRFPHHASLHEIDPVGASHAADLGGAHIRNLHPHGGVSVVDEGHGLAEGGMIRAGEQATDHHKALVAAAGRDGSLFQADGLHLLTDGLSVGIQDGHKRIGYVALEASVGVIGEDTEHGEHQMAVEEQFPVLDPVGNHGRGIETAHFDEIGVILGVLCAIPNQSVVEGVDSPAVGHGGFLLFEFICISRL